MQMNPRLIGVIAGLVAGLLLVLAGWRVVLILIAFAVGGYFVGMYLESRNGLYARLRRLYSRLFRP